MPASVRTLVAIALVALLVSVAWLRLFLERPPLLSVLEVVGIALLPVLALVLVSRATRRRLAVVSATLVALAAGVLLAGAASFGISLTEARPGPDHDLFGPLYESARFGLRDAFETSPPFDRIGHPEMEALALFSIFGFVAAAGLLIVRRATFGVALVLLLGTAWPATMLAPVGGNSLGAGAVILAALLLVLLIVREGRRPTRGLVQAVALGLVLVLVGVGASRSSAVAKEPILDWQKWSPFGLLRDQVGVRYVWSTSYAGITWPDRPTVVLEVKAPDRPLYWRATTLDEYTGIGWREAITPDPPAPVTELGPETASRLLPEDALAERARLVEQEITVKALSDDHLIATAEPVRWELPGNPEVQIAGNGVVYVPSGLVPEEAYTVWSWAPEVKPDDLIDLGPGDRPGLTRYLEIVPGVAAPPFAVENRAARVDELFANSAEDALLQAQRPLYERALDVVGGLDSPYLAAVGLEQWFRSTGGFTYSEQPGPPASDAPPLVDFVESTRAGYCQHYAGAMAVMLRMLGIPARVAAGFVSGSFDKAKGVWRVADRDAHTWVEVWFPGFGWLPFDPTPGRGAVSGSYSASSDSFALAEAATAQVAAGGASIFDNAQIAELFAEQVAKFRELNLQPIIPPTGRDPFDVRGGAPVGAAAQEDRVGPVVVGLAAAAGALLAWLVLKRLRRLARFATRDPRQVAAACRRDLVGYLADQGETIPESMTLAEIGERVTGRYGVDTSYFTEAVSQARFGPPDAAPVAARRARAELGTLERSIRRELPPRRRVRGALRHRSLLS